jgi:flagellar hook-associated protein 3 FlgL
LIPRLDMISTRVLSQIPRAAIAEGQRRLAEAQIEATTGRHADLGLALGSRVGSAIAFRLQLDAVTNSLGRVERAALSADVTQTSLSTLSELANGFQSMLAGSRGAENGKSLAANSALSSLEAMHTTLSTTYDGQYVFGGLMTETAPLAPYSAGPRQAISGAFEASFGFPPSDPAAAALSPADIEGFLDTAFADLFSDGEWTATWSAASDEGLLLRLGPGGAIDLQTNTNRPFARSLAQAFSMVEVLGNSRISRDAFQTVADRALSRVSEAQLRVGAEQARIGTGQSRLKLASGSLDASKVRLTSAIQALESVDSYEAATRINLLMSQLETSYALTGRISRMSLLSYI